MIAHLVSFESFPKRSVLEEERSDGKRSDLKRNDRMLANYKAIRKELEKYDKNLKLGDDGLSKKEEIIVLTKFDVIEDQKIINKKITEFKKISKKVFVLSLYDDKSVKTFRDELVKILKKKV
jgi:GTPase involved in cell partitioning and DNA repair